MSAKNPKAGRGPCPTCGNSVLFRHSPASGRLAYSCDTCDTTGYADPGGTGQAQWRASIKVDPGAALAPAPSPAPSTAHEPTPKPAGKRVNSVFNLGNL